MIRDGKNYITVGEIRQAIADVPDDVIVCFNVEEPDNENWDTFDVSIHNDSYLCEGHDECTHTEPEMLYDIVVFVRHSKLGADSITSPVFLNEVKKNDE